MSAIGSPSTNNKSASSSGQKSAIGPGAPVAYNTGLQGKPYRDSWDIERAYREGMQKVTWVNRCIDAIAGNQARLPAILREDNSPDGKIVTNNRDHKILNLLNTKANIGENSFVFRYRLSSQLLLSKRGVFIQVVKSRGGELLQLVLLPPDQVVPVPHPKKFISGYDFTYDDGASKEVKRFKPEEIIWIRRPHPFDAYSSITPLESCCNNLLDKLAEYKPGIIKILAGADKRQNGYKFINSGFNATSGVISPSYSKSTFIESRIFTASRTRSEFDAADEPKLEYDNIATRGSWPN
jgi:hypothetical protein